MPGAALTLKVTLQRTAESVKRGATDVVNVDTVELLGESGGLRQ